MNYQNLSGVLSQATLKYQENIDQVQQKYQEASNTAAENSNDFLKTLQPGQVFAAEITDIRGNFIQIALENNQTLLAKIMDSFEFVIGQRATFQVKENNNGQIVLKPENMQAFKNPENAVALKALEAAGISINEKTVDLVKNLIKTQQPIDRQTLVKYMKETTLFPKADIQSIITLHKHNIPINQETLNQLENYKSHEHQILKEMQNLTDELPKLFSDAIRQDGKGEAVQLMNKVMDILLPKQAGEEEATNSAKLHNMEPETKPTENYLSEKNPLSVPQREELGQLIRELGDYPELQKNIKDSKAPAEEILKQIKELITKEETLPQHTEKLLAHNSFKTLLKEAVRERMLLDPKELQKEGGVKKYYQRVSEQSKQLEQILMEFGKQDSAAFKSNADLGGNMRFMNYVNDMMAYVQLPLKLQNQEAHGELFVYTKKKKIGKNGEEMTAVLHLDMEHLGAVDVFVQMKGKKIAANFTLDSDEILNYIDEHMDLLEEKLTKKGYYFSGKVQRREKELDFIQDFMERESVQPTEIKRFTFDVRA